MPLITNLTNKQYKKLVLIPGNCLFPDISSLGVDSETLFFMAEDIGLCTRYTYHRHKLIFLISAMRSYRDWLAQDFDVVYFNIEDDSKLSYEEKLTYVLKKCNIESIKSYTFEDRYFESIIRDICKKKYIFLDTVESPGFLTTIDGFMDHERNKKKLLMNNFYISQRKRMGHLLDNDGNPLGGKWSLDEKNRKSLPDSVNVPKLPSFTHSRNTKEVITIIDKLFTSSPGSSSNFYLPTTRKDALLWLEDFLEHRLEKFGPYEDAIRKDDSFLFHSLLSPLLNIGLITPNEVVLRSLENYDKNKDSIPLSSIEGFIRQIIGWREFIRGLYHRGGIAGNFFSHSRRLDKRWYNGTLGIEPVDNVIKKVCTYGYCHHIERLMVMGNFMFLCEIHPDDVYRWFMEMFVDSHEWVMEANVYGLSQFADGGMIATKPYVSGSGYILRMSDFDRGDWCDIWDALYWHFIDKNRDVLKKNFRMNMMVSSYDRMGEDKRSRLLMLAEDFLTTR